MRHCVILSKARRARSKNLGRLIACILLCAVAAFAAPKSASAYYSDAAFQYIENRLPSAEITCNEGLNYYPNDQKLQMLLDRIQEAKDEQQKENQKNDKNQNNQDQQDQGDQNQDQNKDDGQNGSSDSEGSSNSENSSDSQNDSQDQQGQGGESSSSESGNSSDGNGGAGGEPQPEQPEENSSDSNGGDENQPEPQPQMGEMTPEEASQLLKDFDEQNGERRPWKPIRGQARPAKDW